MRQEYEYLVQRKSYRDLGDEALLAEPPEPGDRLAAASLSGNTVIFWWERPKPVPAPPQDNTRHGRGFGE